MVVVLCVCLSGPELHVTHIDNSWISAWLRSYLAATAAFNFTLPDELSMAKRNSSGFFSRRKKNFIHSSIAHVNHNNKSRSSYILSFLAFTFYLHVHIAIPHASSCMPA